MKRDSESGGSAQIKILFVWTGLTNYMGDCWRRLAVRTDVELKVVIVQSERNARQVSFRANEVMRGLDSVVVDDARPLDEEIESGLLAWRPDVLFVVGWRAKICRAFVEGRFWQDVPKVCCFDMPWRWKLRCLFAPIVLGRFLSKYAAAYVPGAVCERYARWLGFRRIYKGLFGIDTMRFSRRSKREVEAEGRNYFLYIGRNAAEKRLDVLRAAHRLYVERGGRIPLRLHGKGLDDGFVEPADVPALMHGAAAFVLTSDFDPWPLVLLEAMSAGCPVIASDRCANRHELGRDWTVFRHGDAEELAQVMLAFDPAVARRKAANGVSAAQPYDCADWAERTVRIARDMCWRAI